MIGVKNSTTERLKAKYDGQEHVFEPNVTTALSEDAARHIFGYGEKDKTRALLRLGWIPNGATIEAGLERLDKFQFLAVEEPKFKEEESAGLPRKVSDAASPEERELSPDELAVSRKLAHQEGAKKPFKKQ